LAHGVAKPQSRPVGCVVRLRPAPATGSSADTIDDAKTPANSALYRLDTPRAATRIDEGSGVMKGLAFSPDVVARQCGLARQMDYSFSLGAGGAVGSRGPYSYFQGSDGYANGLHLRRRGARPAVRRHDAAQADQVLTGALLVATPHVGGQPQLPFSG
jgi:hypothetical protein